MSLTSAPSLIRTVAAVIINDRDEVLLVRKRHSTTFIQPGGKKEPDEAPLQTLARELREELGVMLDLDSATALGEFEAPAVNEPGLRVRAEAFHCKVIGEPVAHAEIEELRWVPVSGPYPVPVAPLSRLHVLPAFVRICAKG